VLSVTLYNQPDSAFLESGFRAPDQPRLIVTPNPSIADSVRERLRRRDQLKGTDVITISKFIQELLQKQELDRPIRKSELLLTLSVFWKAMCSDLGDEAFSQAFTLLTELRSFSTDLSTIDEVLEEYHAGLARAVRIFWSYMDSAEIVDEHRAYASLAAEMKEVDLSWGQQEGSFNLIFYGFANLTGGQVDLLKALSVRNDIVIPLPARAYQVARPSDWVHWLGANIIDLEDEIREREGVQLIRFPQKRMASALLSFIEKSSEVWPQMVLLQKKPSLENLLEVPSREHLFRASIDPFIRPLEETFSLLTELAPCPTLTCLNFLTEKLQELRKQGTGPDFLFIKVIDQVIKTVTSWQEMAAANEEMTSFDLKVLREVVELDLPRVNAAPIHSDPFSHRKILGLEGIDGLDLDQNAILCFNSNYLSPAGRETALPEKVALFLSAIGPMKGRDFEMTLVKEQIKQALSSRSAIFLEQGIEHHDAFWGDLLDELGLGGGEMEIGKRQNNVGRDPLRQYLIGELPTDFKFSPSKLQTYADCPRKFYLSYVAKLYQSPVAKMSVPGSDMGKLEHDIIRNYAEEFKKYDKKNHLQIIQRQWKKHCRENELTLAERDERRALIELESLTSNGIDLVLNLPSTQTPVFEYGFNANNVRGSMDVVASLMGSGTALIDFKRSEASVPSKRKIIDLEAIQIWSYLRALSSNGVEANVFGYACLKEPKKSQFFITDASDAELLSQSPLWSEVKINPIEEFEIKLEAYAAKEDELMARIRADREFSAKPKEVSTCMFCSVKAICPREVCQ
jgi:CRISPR/Cas system-associated exonuclease Cas4 (RecB family)